MITLLCIYYEDIKSSDHAFETITAVQPAVVVVVVVAANTLLLFGSGMRGS